MDLYSAAKRLTRPFSVDDDWHRRAPLGAHGVIGDGYSCALVRIDGAIDWLCLPRFDSPSVFGAILDADRGGLSAVWPLRRPFESLQRYDPETNVLETLFRVPEQGVIRMTDFMPWSNDPRASNHEVHRRIECPEGEVEMEAVFDPRFDYGLHWPEIELKGSGVLARGPGDRTLVAVIGSGEPWEARPEGGVRVRFRLRAGQRVWMVLSWSGRHPEPIAAYRPFEQLRHTRRAWREWSRQLHYDGPWRHHVVRSALLLKLLIYAPTGAMVAAPTTSLPEWIGGNRNWDYRYSWTRDSALAIRSANLIGCHTEAREFFYFMRDTFDRGNDLRVMYSVTGGEVPAEETLPHLSGYANSAPVRIGNAARSQIQLDTAGALIDAAFLHERFGSGITLRTWRHLREVAETVRRSWGDPDHGIWEIRGDVRHNLHSRLMSWVALDRAHRLAPLFGGDADAKRFLRSAVQIRSEVLERGLDPAGKHFVGWYGGEAPDASLLQLPIYGLLPPTDPRSRNTIDWIRSELATGPFLHRHRGHDGVGGDEGAFVLCGFWLVEALALDGRIEEAQQVFVAHAEASNHVGLLAEEIDPGTGVLLGNFPQAFSHLGLINAAARIDRALRLRDEGSTKLPRFLTEG